MEKQNPHIERRRYPRVSLDLPLEYRVINVPYAHGGLVVNASEVGLLINSVKNIPIGSKLNIAVLFPKGFELADFEVLAEIIWKDLCWEEDWEGYRYGLKFIRILEEDRGKLKKILSGQFQLEEVTSHP
jgi:c-di-GMP-binding flagellar brake protein YcgR